MNTTNTTRGSFVQASPCMDVDTGPRTGAVTCSVVVPGDVRADQLMRYVKRWCKANRFGSRRFQKEMQDHAGAVRSLQISRLLAGKEALSNREDGCFETTYTWPREGPPEWHVEVVLQPPTSAVLDDARDVKYVY